MTPAPEIESASFSRRRGGIPTAIVLAVVGLAAHAVVFFFVSIPIGEGPSPLEADPFASYAERQGIANDLLQEQSALLDSRPLFVPTRWNVASSLQNIARLRDEAELFAPYQPIVRLQPQGWAPQERPAAAPSVAIDQLLLDDALHPLVGFGQREDPASTEPLAPRVASVWLEKLSGDPKRIVFSLPRIPDAQPPVRLWDPAVFYVEIDPRSSGGIPLRSSGSGIAEWDAALGRYLVSPAFRRQLPPGYYRVTIGP